MTRRGHVYRRPTKTGAWSRWYAVIDTEKEPDGRRRQVTRAFDTRAQAYAWLAQQQRAREVGGPTVAVWLRDWLASRADLRASTVATYVGHIDNYLVPLLGGQLLPALTSEDVVALHQQLAAAGVSTVTARRIHATPSSALTAAVEQDVITANPATRLKLPKPGRYQAVMWTAEQASRFLAATSRDQHACLWRLALVLGLRRGELAGLHWDDLDLITGTVTVTTTRVAVEGTVVEGPPKSARSRRMLPLDPHTIGMLRRHQARQTHHARQDNLGPVSRPLLVSQGTEPPNPQWRTSANGQYFHFPNTPGTYLVAHSEMHSDGTCVRRDTDDYFAAPIPMSGPAGSHGPAHGPHIPLTWGTWVSATCRSGPEVMFDFPRGPHGKENQLECIA